MKLTTLPSLKALWQWPEGLIWKWTETLTYRSRRKKYDLFLKEMKPKPADTILDVGITSHGYRYSNFLEHWYPHKHQITALTNEREKEFDEFRRVFPQVQLVFCDALHMEFDDDRFDIVFSNAVIEHVGCEENQRRFVSELIRVGRKVFITTPNYWFPVDPHTLIPFAHYLQLPARFSIYRALGRSYWADLDHLNLLTMKRFISIFPDGIHVRFLRQRLLGFPNALIAVAEKHRSANVDCSPELVQK